MSAKAARMIGYIKGKLLKMHPAGLLVDVNGVGYEVTISLNTFEEVQKMDGAAELFIETVVKENEISLYGFATENEKFLFKMLVSVSGVGPKLAISFLSGMTPQVLVSALRTGNASVLSGIHGVGKKTADRLVLELKDKFRKTGSVEGSKMCQPVTGGQSAMADAVMALISLGFDSKYAAGAVDKAFDVLGGDASVENLVREALRK